MFSNPKHPTLVKRSFIQGQTDFHRNLSGLRTSYFGTGITILFSATSRTGPNNPEANNGESFRQCFQVVKVCRPEGLGLPSRNHLGHSTKHAPSSCTRQVQSSGICSSPMRRFGQRFTTFTSKAFAPAFAADVTSKRNG